MKYLLNVTETYRIPSVEEVKALHDEFEHDPNYQLVGFSYKTKTTKDDEYQVVTAKKVFQEEKEAMFEFEPIYSYGADKTGYDIPED